MPSKNGGLHLNHPQVTSEVVNLWLMVIGSWLMALIYVMICVISSIFVFFRKFADIFVFVVFLVLV